MSFLLVSSAFKDDGFIPPWYCRGGSDCSPPLGWTAPPAGAASLALTVRSSPGGEVLWVVYNIPPEERTFWGRIPRDEVLFDGASQGRNSAGNIGWDGPGAGGGEETVRFTLAALDIVPDLGEGATAEELEGAMKGHVIETAQLIGRYRPH